MKLESKWVKAVMRQDTKMLDRILADDYIGTSSSGERRNKSQTITALKSSTTVFVSFEPYDFDLHISEHDVCFVTGRVRLKVLYQQREISSEFRFTKVYVRRQKRWQVVALHTSNIT